jgi:hypothetical protein
MAAVCIGLAGMACCRTCSGPCIAWHMPRHAATDSAACCAACRLFRGVEGWGLALHICVHTGGPSRVSTLAVCITAHRQGRGDEGHGRKGLAGLVQSRRWYMGSSGRAVVGPGEAVKQRPATIKGTSWCWLACLESLGARPISNGVKVSAVGLGWSASAVAVVQLPIRVAAWQCAARG